MTDTLTLRFPDEWVVLPCAPDAREQQLAELQTGLADCGPEAVAATTLFVTALADRLVDVGVSGMAALMLVAEGDVVRACCAIGSVDTGLAVTEETLIGIAEAGPHPGQDRQTSLVSLPIGVVAISSAIRWAVELVDAAGVAPYVAEVRYVFRIDERRAGILHFETDTVVYLDDLEPVFTGIASTVSLA